MKKTFLLIAAFLMLGSAAFAGGGIDLAIGPKVGFQTAKLSYDKADIKAGFSNHFTAGLFGRVTVGRIYVQPEVLYFKTSNIFDVNVTGTDINENLFNLPTGAEANLTLNSMNLQVPIMIGFNVIDLDVSSGRYGSSYEGPCFYLIRYDRILSAFEAAYPPDLDYICTGSPYIRSHLVEKVRNVYDMRFLGYVLQYSSAFSLDSSEHRIDRCSDRDYIKKDMSTLEAGTCIDINDPLIHIRLCAESFERL